MTKLHLHLLIVVSTFWIQVLPTFAQAPTQTIRGTVIDKVSEEPIIGALITVTSVEPNIKAVSNEEGYFKLNQVPSGQQSLKITFMGYQTSVLQNISVNSGKELVLTIALEEDIKQLKEVVVTAKEDKNSTVNEMSAVSTRKFSVEETQKFAAAVNDPGRMATSFAGVVSADDGNNTISIRGNSPNGLLWRMEGVEIPNPNHFANVGTSGGGISILSAQLLSNSDFSTGAFAAEYGNALSGIFDLKLRKGNNEKREFTVQAGLLGLDVSTEGYFKKGYGGSYLINYRYSTLSILGKIGVPLGNAVTNFQDLSYNIILPTKNLGTFTAFGFGGLSSQTVDSKKDSLSWKTDEFNRYDSKFNSNTAAIGFTQKVHFKNKAYLKNVVLLAGNQNDYNLNKLNEVYNPEKQYMENYRQTRTTFSSTYTQKLSLKNSLRAGLIYNILNFDLMQKIISDSSTQLQEKLKQNGNTQTTQAFVQWNHKFNPRFSSNLGFHSLYLFLNKSFAFDPRASLRFDATEKNVLTLGYGLHSQVQPLGLYFAKADNNTELLTNRNIGFNRAHHIVAGYDHIFSSHTHFKTELYYQYLFNIPISEDPNKHFSTLNMKDGFATEALVNKGFGENYGAEFTFERYLHKGFYFLISNSVYESKYKANSNVWQNTRFNTNFSSVITMGKDWDMSKNNKNRTLGMSFKSMYVGGQRYTPIDEKASIEKGDVVYKEDQAYSIQNPNYYRLDLRISWKRNLSKRTSIWSLDIQNSTNRKNIGGQYFDTQNLKVKYWYQTPLIPILSYRLQF